MPVKVLIVEPDAALRLTFGDVLSRAGYDVVEARTFQEARRIIKDYPPPGILVTEIRLAGFNGLHLIIANMKPIPSVVISSADPVLQAEALRYGALYLVKPVSHAELLVAVERQLATAGTIVAPAKRRWTRKPVHAELRASIDDSPARVIDVSYGGLRVEVERASERPLPRQFSVKLSDINFPADLVWSSRVGTRGWQCGVALARLGQTEATAWRGLVDMIP